jgi:secondary thiamine-phosphate synthase enzyme
MTIYSESIPLQSSKKREAINVHSRIKAAVEKSALREGVAIVSSVHSDTAVILLQDDPALLEQLDRYLDRLTAIGEIGPSATPLDPAPAAQIQGALLGRQVALTFSEARLDLGAREVVFFLELDGIHPRSLVIKIIGE